MKYKKEIKKMIPWMLLSFCIYFLIQIAAIVPSYRRCRSQRKHPENHSVHTAVRTDPFGYGRGKFVLYIHYGYPMPNPLLRL